MVPELDEQAMEVRFFELFNSVVGNHEVLGKVQPEAIQRKHFKVQIAQGFGEGFILYSE